MLSLRNPILLFVGLGWATLGFLYRPFPLPVENSLLNLVAFHTPRFYGGLVLWYYLSPAVVVLMGELLLVSA